MRVREYKIAESLEEAWELNQKRTNRIVGGNIWLRLSRAQVGCQIDISRLGLDKIEETDEEFIIGSMVTLRELETDKALASYTCGAMKEALRHIIGVQLRNLATLGGSIHGRFGFSDVLTLFLAMDSQVELYKGGMIPLEDYAKMGPDNDIIVAIHIRKEKAKFAYSSVRTNAGTDFPVLTGAMAELSDGNYRCVIGARPARAMRFKAAEIISGKKNNEESAELLADSLKDEIKTSGNMRGSAEYRRHLSGVLARRMMKQMRGEEA